ncbi:AEC family transporter [Luteococcus peritonei]|uniref:AEC family transporter n=1 Tax=Luteococcus peritonei TaxID=88874 RepID=A0ABW4RZS7_9ACTN
MHELMIVISALLPVMVTTGMGWFAGSRRLIDTTQIPALNSFVMNFALPCAMFVAIGSSSRADLLGATWLLVVIMAAMAITFAGMWPLLRRIHHVARHDAAVLAITAAMPNSAAVGLPLLGALFGPSAALPVSLAVAAGSLTITPATIVLLRTNPDDHVTARQVGTTLLATLRKPICFAPLAGAVWVLVAVPFPGWLHTTLTPLAQTAGGAALFVTGLVLSTQRLGISRNTSAIVIAKNLIQPLIGLGLCAALPISPLLERQALVLLAIPSGFFGLLFGLDHDVAPRDAGWGLTASTVAAAVTLSVAVSITL